MANEITNSDSVTVVKGGINDSLTGSGTVSMSNDDYLKATQLIPTSATAIALGSLGSIGEFIIVNNDTTNYVDILSSTSGTTFLTIKPGNSAHGYFASTVTAPAARANTASVQITYLIAET